MSDYKTELQSNNVDLQAALDLVRSLPDKGVEVEEATINFNGSNNDEINVTYTDVSGLLKTVKGSDNASITDVMKGCICVAISDYASSKKGYSTRPDYIGEMSIIHDINSFSSAGRAALIFICNGVCSVNYGN